METIKFTKSGHEIPDPKPIEEALKLNRAPTLNEIIQASVMQAINNQAVRLGHESIEEADNYNIPDDPIDPNIPMESGFEVNEQTAEIPMEFGPSVDAVKDPPREGELKAPAV